MSDEQIKVTATRRAEVGLELCPCFAWSPPVSEREVVSATLADDLLRALVALEADYYATWMSARADVEGASTSSRLFGKELSVINARAAIARAREVPHE